MAQAQARSSGAWAAAMISEKAPLFSVVIPTYNRSDLLLQTLESVFQQEFKDFEVIVVDDGSTEDVSSAAEKFLDRVTLLRQANAGPGAARNLGATVARGEYLAFLDSDDVWFPWTLQIYASVINDDHPAILLGNGVPFEQTKELQSVSNEVAQFDQFRDFFSSSHSVIWAGAGALAIRRDTFMAATGFAGGVINAEDLDFLLRVGTASGFTAINHPKTFGYRQHLGNTTKDIERTLLGISRLIDAEREGIYPGRESRARERLALLTRFLRPPSLSALSSNRFRDAFAIYWLSLPWHFRLRRWKYIIGFPLLGAASLLAAAAAKVVRLSSVTRRNTYL